MMESIEIWKEVKGYEGLYVVSSFGNVKSVERTVEAEYRTKMFKGRPLSPDISNAGYKRVKLNKSGKKSGHSVHRLVAAAFIENPFNLPQVNHIDGDKLNNTLSNLEWVSRKENMIHASRNNLIKGKSGKDNYAAKKVFMFDFKGNLIRSFDCVMDAHRATGISRTLFQLALMDLARINPQAAISGTLKTTKHERPLQPFQP